MTLGSDVRRRAADSGSGPVAVAEVYAAKRLGTGFQGVHRSDTVAREEPLEMRIEHAGQNIPFAVTMRTPGDDILLTAGFLFTEGVIEAAEDLVEVRPCRSEGADGVPVENIVQAFLAPTVAFDADRLRRNVYQTSSCGICGKASIDMVEVACAPLAPAAPFIDAAVLSSLPAALRALQASFAQTGGLHATAVVSSDGTIEDVREDVGRHNAMDKVIGAALLGGRLPLSDRILLVSGRASFELVQKAARAGAPVLTAIGAPSSLALEAAERLGLTVIGFLGPERFNVYTHPERVRGVQPGPTPPAGR